MNVDRYGNTSSGSIPLALADAADDGRLEPGQAGVDDRDGRGPHLGLGADRMDAFHDWSHGMTKIAFMFPGQGSFEPGMGAEIAAAIPEAMAVYDAGSKASGLDLRALCFSGSAEELMQTEVQQPTLVATSLAINAALRARGINPDYVVGHSVGEFSALGAAGSMGVSEAIGARARARPRHGRGGEGAPRLDGRDPRPRRRGGRGPLPQDRERVAGELQLPGPARDLGRDRRRRRGLLRGAARRRAPRDPAARSRARSTRRSSRTRPSGCGRRSTRSTSRCRPRSSSRP